MMRTIITVGLARAAVPHGTRPKKISARPMGGSEKSTLSPHGQKGAEARPG
jgi:hypothetical protein